MKKLPVKIKKFILKKVLALPIPSDIELCNLLEDLYREIYDYSESDLNISDSILERLINFTDRSSEIYEDIALYLISILNKDIRRLSEVYESKGVYRIKPLVTLTANTINEIHQLNEYITSWEVCCNNFSEQYEAFCAMFLKDYGLILVNRTKRSGDNGIDIICKTKLIETDYLGIHEVDVLCQVKFLSTPIDQPVIRRLIGDSLLISFDGAIYPNITHSPKKLLIFSHKGFTKGAETLAKRTGVSIIDTQWIFKWIVSQPNLSQLNCVKYLKKQRAGFILSNIGEMA